MQGHVKVVAVRTVGALNIGKSEMARPPLPVPFFRVGTQDVTASYQKCPKNAAWPRQNVTTLNQNVRYLNQNVRFLSVNLFCVPVFSMGYQLCSEFFFFRPPSLILWVRGDAKLETGNSKLKAVSSFQFPVSNFQFPRPPGGRPLGRRPASFLPRPWGKARGGAAAERVRGGQEPREPIRLRHSEHMPHLQPAERAIFMPLSYGLSTKR